MGYDVEAVPAAATWALRQAVLRPHQDVASQALPDDDDPTTATFAVRDPNGAVVSTARVARSALPPALDPAAGARAGVAAARHGHPGGPFAGGASGPPSWAG